MKRKLNMKPVIASMHLSNTGGIGMHDILNEGVESYCEFSLFTDEQKSSHRCKVFTTMSGRDYVRWGSMRLYLDQFMKGYMPY